MCLCEVEEEDEAIIDEDKSTDDDHCLEVATDMCVILAASASVPELVAPECHPKDAGDRVNKQEIDVEPNELATDSLKTKSSQN